VILEVIVRNLAGSLSVVATNLAYPLADVVLIGFVVGTCALLGWRPGRSRAMLGLGFVSLVIADSIYVFQSAAGTYASGAAVDAIWTAAMLLVALAAWQPAGRTRDRILEGRTALVLPSLFIAVGISVVTYDHFVPVNLVAIGLAVATLVAAAVRTALSFRDLRNLAESRRQALTDDLTGLPNRRAFSKKLERAFAASPNRDGGGTCRAMLLIDLDQFKEVNDTLGHHIGDDLLGLIGPRLAAAIGPDAFLARLGGDEFGVLLEEGSGSAAGVAIAKAVAEATAEPFLLEGITVRPGRAWESRWHPTTVSTATPSCSAPTWPRTRPSTPAAATGSTRLTRTATAGTDSLWSTNCASPSTTATSTSTTNPKQSSRPGASPGSRRWCAGNTL
jgi:diguanylate cyclase